MKYVPMTDQNEKLLQAVVRKFAERGETYSENRVLRMALSHLFGTLTDEDNENQREINFPATLPPVALSTEDAGTGEPAGL
jgi:hypothetical protein